MKEGRKLEYPKKTPGDELRKCHILQPEDSSPKRYSNPRSSIGGQARKADMLTVTPRVAQSGDRLTSQQHASPSNMLVSATR